MVDVAKTEIVTRDLYIDSNFAAQVELTLDYDVLPREKRIEIIDELELFSQKIRDLLSE